MIILKDQELFTPYDVIFLQLVLDRTGCFDLNAKCIDYAEKLEALCFYKKPQGILLFVKLPVYAWVFSVGPITN